MLSPIPTINLEYIVMALNTNMGDHPPVAPKVEPLSNEGVVQGSSPWQVDQHKQPEEAEILNFITGFRCAIIDRAVAEGPSIIYPGLEYVTFAIWRKTPMDGSAHWGDGESVTGPLSYLTIQIRMTPKLLEWARQ